MSQGFYYLSNPYNGSEEIMQHRAEMASRATALFMEKGVHVLSPVVHNHQMVQHLKSMTSESRHGLIMPFDLELLNASKGMFLLKLEGWEKSRGVAEEINFCLQAGKPIYEITFEELQGETFSWSQFKEAS